MHTTTTLSVLLCCLTFTPTVVGASEGGTMKPVAIICTGMVAADPSENFDLTCQLHSLDRAVEGHEGIASNTTRHSSRKVKIQGCDKPGDVIEQGFCLE